MGDSWFVDLGLAQEQIPIWWIFGASEFAVGQRSWGQGHLPVQHCLWRDDFSLDTLSAFFLQESICWGWAKAFAAWRACARGLLRFRLCDLRFDWKNWNVSRMLGFRTADFSCPLRHGAGRKLAFHCGWASCYLIRHLYKQLCGLYWGPIGMLWWLRSMAVARLWLMLCHFWLEPLPCKAQTLMGSRDSMPAVRGETNHCNRMPRSLFLGFVPPQKKTLWKLAIFKTNPGAFTHVAGSRHEQPDWCQQILPWQEWRQRPPDGVILVPTAEMVRQVLWWSSEFKAKITELAWVCFFPERLEPKMIYISTMKGIQYLVDTASRLYHPLLQPSCSFPEFLQLMWQVKMEIQRLADAGRVHVAGGWSLVATPWMSFEQKNPSISSLYILQVRKI